MNFRRIQRLSLYLVFVISGSTGLIYESVWSHYLKLFLGHAAYAQAVVLVLFMGGLAAGSWIVSKRVHTLRNLLLIYALVEAIIGLLALGFHPVFNLVYSLSIDHVFPSLQSPSFILLYKIFIATLLILPQSILLGMTFPLMTGGLIRRFPDEPGKSISLLYCFNTIGAAIAVLITTFYLIEKLGLPGTIMTAGVINIAIAIVVYRLVSTNTSTGPAETDSVSSKVWPRLVIFAAFATGMASFIYEIAWIRMLSMVLGASTHSFELMLSAFITGLGLGGYWIHRKIDRLENPGVFSGLVQVCMGVFALSTIFLYNYSFEIMAFFMAALEESEQGYLLYTLASHSIALLVMLPTTICAGMTLPLFTYILLRGGHGEVSIGQVYSANTVGAISGVIFTIFIGMPVFGLKGAVTSGAIIDVLIGILLIYSFSEGLRRRQYVYACAILVIPVLLLSFTQEFDRHRMSSGVFRNGAAELSDNNEILYHRDGKTASVSVTEWNGINVSIMTNGKTDASITMEQDAPPSRDESTMTLLAALPLAVYPEATRIANIGMGSGLTAHVALTLPSIERVDTIEIEQAMVDGARYFRQKTEKVFDDPRSRIYIEDARTFFSTRSDKYDLIISEPSNPWVSGVASLFTREFYQLAARHLDKNGLLVQWIHIYEFNMDLLVSILKALNESFPYYSVYFADDGNLILLAGLDREIPLPGNGIFDPPAVRELLQTIYVRNLEDLRFRYIGDQSLYSGFLRESSVPPNSDFMPYLELNATRARYLKQDITGLLQLRLSPVPLIDILYENIDGRSEPLSKSGYYPFENPEKANYVYEYFSNRVFDRENINIVASMNFLQSAARNCNQEINYTVWVDSIYLIISTSAGYLTGPQTANIISAITPSCDEIPLPAVQAEWLTLYNALNTGDVERMLPVLTRLLDNGYYAGPQQQQFLLTTLLASLIKTNEQERARQLWDEQLVNFYAEEDIPLEIEILLAKIEHLQ